MRVEIGLSKCVFEEELHNLAFHNLFAIFLKNQKHKFQIYALQILGEQYIGSGIKSQPKN